MHLSLRSPRPCVVYSFICDLSSPSSHTHLTHFDPVFASIKRILYIPFETSFLGEALRRAGSGRRPPPVERRARRSFSAVSAWQRPSSEDTCCRDPRLSFEKTFFRPVAWSPHAQGTSTINNCWSGRSTLSRKFWTSCW